jgi:hypothetical protein
MIWPSEALHGVVHSTGGAEIVLGAPNGINDKETWINRDMRYQKRTPATGDRLWEMILLQNVVTSRE